MNIQNEAKQNCKDILITNYKITSENKVLIIYDKESKLSELLEEGFREACEELNNSHESIEFYSQDPEGLIKKIDDEYNPEDIVILVQSSSFRVSKYRWRNELCSRGLKVVEFGQLAKQDTQEEYEIFIKSLACDFDHYEQVCNYLIPKLESAKEITFISEDGSKLKYSGPMDKCLKNTGVLWENTNWATRFPIGELITEAKELDCLNGELLFYSYPRVEDQKTKFCKPFKATIKDGFLISHEGPKGFDELIEMIKTENPEKLVYVRELGMGLNRNIKRHEYLGDPMSYERQEGLHFSLGMKHGMYQKKLYPKYGRKFYQRFHIDVYVEVDKIFIEDLLIYTKEKGYVLAESE